jgi:hypothetical protein
MKNISNKVFFANAKDKPNSILLSPLSCSKYKARVEVCDL